MSRNTRLRMARARRVAIIVMALLVALPFHGAAAQEPLCAQSSSLMVVAGRSDQYATPTVLEQAVVRARLDPSLSTGNDVLGRPARQRTRGRLRQHVWAAVGAFGGMVAGGYLGVKIERDCRCDDPGLQGLIIGMPIGLVAGGVLGYWLSR